MAHKKRYKKLSRQLCEQAVVECFKGKWRRNDVLTFIEKYAGIPRDDIKIDDLSGSWKYKNEAVEAIGLAMLGIVEDLVDHGIEPDDMEPVTIRQRPDGMTGKIRDIALLCIMHQLIGHITKLMIEPLIQARLLPTQHASIPGHGQTMLKDQMLRYFLKESLGIEYVRKTDVVHAYASLQYDVCIELVMMEIPKARYAIGLLKYLKSVAPGGHLIIGGYLDAWLFNFAMSYAIRYLYTLGSTRRGKRAQKIISYNSYIEQSDSFHLQERYHTEELLQVAHCVNGFYGQLEYQKRMEELHDLLERRCRSEAGKGNDGKSSGWRNDRQDGGQYQGIPSGRRKGSEDVPF